MNIKDIDDAILEGESLKAIAQAYSEIANLKIKKIRDRVEKNRQFFDEILRVYSLVKAFALQKKVAIVKPKKRLCILLTSNYRFYGNINSSLINYFIGSTRELLDIDRVILGKGGINYFKAAKVLPNYQEIILAKDLPTPQELANLANISADYNQVLVFHSKFKSLLVQQATFADITAVSLFMSDFYVKQLNPKGNDRSSRFISRSETVPRFIFEPELPKMLRFFDSQILTLLLEQTFLESELSRTASRFISMDQAESEADKFIKEYHKLKAITKRNTDNNAILENFATMMAVRKM